MSFFLYSSAFFIVVFTLILVHELGHFLVARFFQVKVERFSLGFGKPFYKWRSKNGFTEYTLAPFIFGGYVKLLDTRDTATPAKYWHCAFNNKPLLQRLVIISAGPIANIILALLAFWLMFVIGFELPKPIIGKVLSPSIASYAGMQANEEIVKVDNRITGNWSEVVIAMLARAKDKGNLSITTRVRAERMRAYKLDLTRWELNSYRPDPLADFGLERYKPRVLPLVDKVAKNSPAATMGLKAGDLILAVAGVAVADWEEFIQQIKLYPQQVISLVVKRGGQALVLTGVVGWRFDRGWKKIGFLGASVDIGKMVWPKHLLQQYRYKTFTALPAAKNQMLLFIELNKIILSKLLQGKISLHILGGPIATFTASGYAMEQGLVTFLGFLAMLSLTIAMINLLPLPGLDGGHIVLTVLEAIRGRPVSKRIQMLIFRLGIALFVLLLLQTTANDLVRIFSA